MKPGRAGYTIIGRKTAATGSDSQTASATLVLAILTGVLGLATFVLAGITYYGVKSAQADARRQIKAARKAADDQIEATRETAANEIEAMRETTAEQLAAARDELDASQRPLFIDVFPTGPVYP